MDERLEKQLAFSLEIDKVKNILARRTSPSTEDERTMPSIRGTWR